MRKLRKHPETKDVLGVEFVSGWDSFNVAQALALPQFIINKLKKSPISSFICQYRYTQCIWRFRLATTRTTTVGTIKLWIYWG